MRHLAIVAGLVVSLGIAGCGNDDLDLDSLFDGATTTTTMAPTTTMGATTTTSTTSTSSTIVTTTMPVTTTTSTTSSTIVTTTLPVTTTTSTTTTTLAGSTSTIVFTLDDAVSLGALQFDVGYANAAGAFAAGATGVDCTVNSAVGGFGAFNDDSATEVVSIGLISLSGFTGPLEVATCVFNGVPSPSDFVLTITDASDPATNPVSPTPSVSIAVVPDGTTTTMPATTTTSTTTTSTIVTTTLPVTTTTSTTTTTLAGGATSILTFTLDDAVNLGALQFDVGYANAAGNFIAGALGPDCTTNGGVGGFGAYNDNTASSVASVGLISLAGFTGPMDVATCRFDGAPLAGDFTITVTDASDPLTNPVSPLPAVSISVAPE